MAIFILAATFPATAQEIEKVYRVGILSNAPKSIKAMEQRLDVFRDELRTLGYVEGRNIEFHYRYPQSMAGRAAEQFVLARELVTLEPDVIFTFSSPATDSVKKATRVIPIVVGVGVDRFVANFSRPDENITGLSSNAKGLIGKQLEIFLGALPQLQKVAVLWNPDHGEHPRSVEDAHKAARTLGLQMIAVPAATPSAYPAAFRTMVDAKVDGVLILRGGMFINSRPQLSELANKHGIPSMFGHPVEVEAGGLICYGTNVSALFRRAAVFVDKILRGSKPEDIPVERPIQFDLVVDLRTAQKLGLTIPPSVLLLATKVIE